MNMIGVDDKKAIIVTLEKILQELDPDGTHRFYTDPKKAADELDMPVDVAFLDVEMPGMSGVSLAEKLMKRYPKCNIIFLTGYSEYMARAFGMNASGYILKPFSKKKVRDALDHRRYRTSDLEDKPVKIRCFGNFEVFVKENVVPFKRQKSKELFAYLIDRKGAMCDADMIIGNIESNAVADETEKSKIRVYSSDIVSTFANLGIHDILTKSKGLYGVNTKLLDCDYYRFLENDSLAIAQYTGEYMTQYEFARETRTFLKEKYRKEH